MHGLTPNAKIKNKCAFFFFLLIKRGTHGSNPNATIKGKIKSHLWDLTLIKVVHMVQNLCDLKMI